MDRPEISYARSGDIDIAYTVLGEGPPDVVFVSGFVSNLDLQWDLFPVAHKTAALADRCRLIAFDKRGTGLSGRSLGAGSVSDRMDDIRAVMDAAGVENAALWGISEGGPLSIAYAATYPERVSRLALYGTFARILHAPDYPDGMPRPTFEGLADRWGTGEVMRFFVAGLPDDRLPDLARYERSTCTPQMVIEIMERNVDMDVRYALSAITVPTMIVHDVGDRVVPIQHGRYLAEHIAGAEMVETSFGGHVVADQEWPHPDLVAFLTSGSSSVVADRMLATVLFTDIVSSTKRASELGDRSWRSLLDRHDQIAAEEVARFEGRLIKTTGDGLLATFDGPARGIRCAESLKHRLSPLDLDIRAGVHTGEVELRGEDITGLGVVVARRVCDVADDGEVLASRTVKDLVLRSGIAFDDRGTHALKGVPDEWQLFAVSG